MAVTTPLWAICKPLQPGEFHGGAHHSRARDGTRFVLWLGVTALPDRRSHRRDALRRPRRASPTLSIRPKRANDGPAPRGSFQRTLRSTLDTVTLHKQARGLSLEDRGPPTAPRSSPAHLPHVRCRSSVPAAMLSGWRRDSPRLRAFGVWLEPIWEFSWSDCFESLAGAIKGRISLPGSIAVFTSQIARAQFCTPPETH
jgi:hypothetical protein